MNHNRRHLPRRLAVVVAATVLLATACGASGDDEVASVRDRSLSESDFRALVASSGGDEADAPVVSASLAAQVIGEWVTWESWIAEMDDRGTPLTEDYLAIGRDQLLSSAAQNPALPDPDSDAGRILTRYFAVPHLVADHLISAEDIRALCSSHILLDTRDEALAAIERLEAGEDFAALAMELSVGPTAPTGGDLGCVVPRTFVAEFVEGADLVDAPGISEPVQSDFGWHVISVRSFEAPARDGHPELTGNEVTNFVLGGFDPEVRTLQAEVISRDVDVDARFGRWDPATGQVVPAAALG